jgi:hypothetical protein
VKPPSTIDPKWWKSNKPKSLPKSPVDKLIASCAAMSLKEKQKKIAEWADSNKSSMNVDVADIVLQQENLLTELKRFRAVVMKAKHADFANAIDVMIKLAQNEVKVLRADWAKAEKAAKSGDIAKIEAKKQAELANATIKALNTDDQALRAEVHKHLKDIAAGAKGADQAKSFENLFGMTRFLVFWVKNRIRSFKGDMEVIVKQMANAGGKDSEVQKYFKAAEAAALLRNSIPEWNKLKEACQAADKALLKSAVSKLGKKEAAACYTGAKAVKLKISSPKKAEIKLKFKK